MDQATASAQETPPATSAPVQATIPVTPPATTKTPTKKPRSEKQIAWAKTLGNNANLLKQQKEARLRKPAVIPPIILPIVLVVGSVGLIGYWYFKRKSTTTHMPEKSIESVKPEMTVPVVSSTPLMI